MTALLSTYNPNAIGTPGFYGSTAQTGGPTPPLPAMGTFGNGPGTGPMATPSGGANVAMEGNGGAIPYAHGGRVGRRGGMIEVHAQPHELDFLDIVQTKRMRKKDGRRAYPGIERMLQNNHIADALERHVKHAQTQRMAEGGHAMHPISEHNGRYGDTEIAWIGPRTRRLFDMALGHTSHNPYDGHPEYFGLSDLLGGFTNFFGNVGNSLYGGLSSLGRTLAPVVKNALPTIGQIAGGALGSEFGNPMLGAQLGGMAGNMGSNLMSRYIPESNEMPSGWGQHAEDALQGGLNAYQQGGNRQQVAGSVLQGLGRNMNSPLGLGFQGAGSNYARTGNLREAAGTGIQSAASSMDSPWAAGLGSAAGAYGRGATVPQAAGYGLSSYGGMTGGMPGRAMQGAGETLQQGGGLQDAARRAMMSAFAPAPSEYEDQNAYAG